MAFKVNLMTRDRPEFLSRMAISGLALQSLASDKPPPQRGGSGNGLQALFRPEAGK